MARLLQTKGRSVLRIGVAAVCSLALVWRIHGATSAPRVQVSPRVAELMYMRMLAQWIQGYSKEYGRAAFTIDSVEAHLGSGDAETVRDLRASIYGGGVDYAWDYCGFSLSVATGIRRPVPSKGAKPRPSRAFFDMSPSGILESYPLPEGVGRMKDCRSVE
jgi:hypothetical protein